MLYMITYQKSNGDIFFRARKSTLGLKIGDETSMGWTVLDIHEYYDGNYYHEEDIRRMISRRMSRPKPRKRVLKFIVRQLNKLI